jgi:hypothetical protein
MVLASTANALPSEDCHWTGATGPLSQICRRQGLFLAACFALGAADNGVMTCATSTARHRPPPQLRVWVPLTV